MSHSPSIAISRFPVPRIEDLPEDIRARILRIRAKNPLLADQVAVNYRKADITPRQQAMLEFAMTVSVQAHVIGEADFERLREHGFEMDDVWDIAAISAFFGLSNRMANVTSMRPNDEFYSLGR